MIGAIGFDADDTLWHNEIYYSQANAKIMQLLSGYQSAGQIERTLGETEIRNIARYGYGIKSYTLSMIEAAIALTGGQITSGEIASILKLGQGMLAKEVQLFDHAEQTVVELAGSYNLMLITKGDLLEQENKIARSGLAGYFHSTEIVREKTADAYRQLLERYNIQPGHFLMVGNSLKSDIMPVLEIGGQAVYIPYRHTWAHESVSSRELSKQSYFEIEHLGHLPALVASVEG